MGQSSMIFAVWPGLFSFSHFGGSERRFSGELNGPGSLARDVPEIRNVNKNRTRMTQTFTVLSTRSIARVLFLEISMSGTIHNYDLPARKPSILVVGWHYT